MVCRLWVPIGPIWLRCLSSFYKTWSKRIFEILLWIDEKVAQHIGQTGLDRKKPIDDKCLLFKVCWYFRPGFFYSFGWAKVAILLSKVAVSVTLDINPSILCRDHVVPGVWWKLIGQTLIKLDQKTEELAPNSKICMKTRGAEWKRQCYSV
jgi:hypothetical protein